MYEYINGKLVYNPNASLMSGFNMDPIATRQDFGQQATGYGAILQPFDANLGNINILPGGDMTAPDLSGGGSSGGGGGGTGSTGGTYFNADYNLDSLFFPKQDISAPDYGTYTPPKSNVRVMTPEELPTPTTSGGGGGGFGSRFASNMGSPQAMAGMASGIGGIIGGLMGSGARRSAQLAAQDEYDRMRKQYMDLDTSNIYAGVRNKYSNMENAYEDLTVNKQQAEFEQRMFQQQQASAMTNLRGAAGSSGIAGLAQALSNQASVQSQKAAGSIGLQESRNQVLRAQEASKIIFAERGGESQAEAMRLAGAETARGLEYQKTGTLFGMAQQDLAAANAAVAAGDAALYGGIGQIAGTVLTAGISDRRMKKNIKLIGNSPSGLNIYSFEYINSSIGEGVYQGVMSDEVPSEAVVYSNNGYDMVNYSILDVEFKRIN